MDILGENLGNGSKILAKPLVRKGSIFCVYLILTSSDHQKKDKRARMIKSRSKPFYSLLVESGYIYGLIFISY